MECADTLLLQFALNIEACADTKLSLSSNTVVQAIQIVFSVPITVISLDQASYLNLLCETCAVIYGRAFASRKR